MNSKLILASATSYFKDFNSLIFGSPELEILSPAESKFQSFMADFSKNYPSQEEYDMRFEIFKGNLDFVESHPEDTSFRVAINDMSDWTQEEFGRISGSTHQKKRMAKRVGAGVKILSTSGLPTEVDWRRSGAVTTAIRQ